MIYVDTREKPQAIKKILAYYKKNEIEVVRQKLDVGDYMFPDGKISVDRKQNLAEVALNLCQQRTRFKAECERAMKGGIKLVILVEHGGDIRELEDVFFWDNPRIKESPKATTGQALFRSLLTIRDRYGVRFEFCDKRHTGERIVELLSNGTEK